MNNRLNKQVNGCTMGGSSFCSGFMKLLVVLNSYHQNIRLTLRKNRKGFLDKKIIANCDDIKTMVS